MDDLDLYGRVSGSARGSSEWSGWVEQIQELTERNAALLAQLDRKDDEIAALEERVIALEPLGGGTGVMGSGDPRDVKIIELSKRNRALNMGLQKKKAKIQKLKDDLKRYKEIADSKVYPQRLRGGVEHEDEESDEEGQPKRSEAADAEAQIKALTTRAEAMRMKFERCQAELKATQRALQAEVGADVNISTVVEESSKGSGSGWKGRAQKIVVMKAKMKDMRDEINALRERLGEEPLPADGATVMTAVTRRTVSTTRTRLDVDASAKYELQEASREKARALEKAQDDLEAANAELEDTRQKLEGAKARAKVLDNESKKLKNHVRVLLEKTGTDDQLIDALREEVKAMRERVVKSSLAANAAEPSSPSRADADTRTMRQTIDQHSKQVAAQEEIIRTLRAQVKTLRDQLRDKPALDSSLSKSSGLSRPRSGEIRAQAAAEVEHSDSQLRYLRAENLRLSEFTTSLQAQLQSAVAQQEEYIRRVSELEIKCSDASMKPAGGRPPASNSIPVKVKALKDENDALRATYQQLVDAKDTEIRSLKAMLSSLRS